MKMSPALLNLNAAEARLAKAVTDFIPELGLNRMSVNAGARALGLSDGERDLIAPHGAADIAAILWRGHDAILALPDTTQTVSGLKIRERIGFLLNLRLDEAVINPQLSHRLMGFFALPQHSGLYHRLLWETADRIWRLAGDQALDENHYSKRAIVSGILTTGLMTRLSHGRAAQEAQISRNIEQVMAFEKFKARIPARPEDMLLDLAARLGKLRFGRAEQNEPTA